MQQMHSFKRLGHNRPPGSSLQLGRRPVHWHVCHAAQLNGGTTDRLLLQELETLRAQVAELQQAAATRAKRKLSRADYDLLPHRLILIRHAESHGNINANMYCMMPDNAVPLTEKGKAHARQVGKQLRDMLEQLHGDDLRLFIMTSPYRRTLETTDEILENFTDDQIAGVRQAVQLREQDFGNLQNPNRISASLSERQQFGRFWFRFDNGESGSDVYDRLTIFEDHLTRDMLMGRFANCSLLLVTHGLTLRIFLMRWFHWSVDEFLEIYNPRNGDPIVVEKLPWEDVLQLQGRNYAHAKHCYAITPESQKKLRGCLPCMSSYFSRQTQLSPREMWRAQRQRMTERGIYNNYEDCFLNPESSGESDTEAAREMDRVLHPDSALTDSAL